MTEAILLVLAFALLMALYFREQKARKDKENYDVWISNCRSYLHSIESEFRCRCIKITEETIEQYSKSLYHCSHLNDSVRDYKINALFDITHKHNNAINDLKKEYCNELYSKAVERMEMYRITSVPDILLKEYERNISEVADSFCDFGSLMWDQIIEIREDYIKMTDVYESI